ncbi:MAG: hypothetical protein IJS03_08380 [Eubacterium sp.]|nr:hypothetical protein [Eubacterium sp.]
MSEKKKSFSIRRLIFNDKYLIITSLLLAMVVWIVTSLNIGTNETKTIKVNVPIQLGDEVSDQLGMQYYTLQDTIELSVTISGAKYAIGQVNENDLKITFDTSNVNKTGEQTIPILVNKKTNKLDFTISSTYPSSVDAFFDVKESKTFDLYLAYDETATADGYLFGTPVLSEDKIVVSGPKTYVDRVDRAIVNVDFPSGTELKEKYTSECAISFEGSGVEASYFNITSKADKDAEISTVAVTLPVLKVKTLPVAVNIDDMPKGFDKKLMSIEYSVDEVEAGVLDGSSIKQATIGSVSFSQLKLGSNEFTFDVSDIEGLSMVNKDIEKIDAVITISNEYVEKTATINKSNIEITGLKGNKTAVIESISSRNVTLYVPKANANDTLTLDVKCDVSEKNDEGSYPLTISVRGSNSSWAYGTYTANVKIK